jgi:hypothetical protein
MKKLILSWLIMIFGVLMSLVASNSLHGELILAVAVFSALWLLKNYQKTLANDN